MDSALAENEMPGLAQRASENMLSDLLRAMLRHFYRVNVLLWHDVSQGWLHSWPVLHIVLNKICGDHHSVKIKRRNVDMVFVRLGELSSRAFCVRKFACKQREHRAELQPTSVLDILQSNILSNGATPRICFCNVNRTRSAFFDSSIDNTIYYRKRGVK